MAMDRNVAWQSFQLQSALLCHKVSSHTMEECRDFLTPKQFYEVVVERNVSGCCGWPLCAATVMHQSKGTKAPDSANSTVQLDVNEFCSKICFTDTQNYIKQMNVNPAKVRSVSQKEVSKDSLRIAELLDIFHGIDINDGEPGVDTEADEAESEASIKPKVPPPSYGAPPMVTHPLVGKSKVAGNERVEDADSTAIDMVEKGSRTPIVSPRVDERVVLINGVPTSLPVYHTSVTGVGGAVVIKSPVKNSPAASPASVNSVEKRTGIGMQKEKVVSRGASATYGSSPTSTDSTPSSSSRYKTKKMPIFLPTPPPATPVADTIISLSGTEEGLTQQQTNALLPFDADGNLSGTVVPVIAKDLNSIDLWFKDADAVPSEVRLSDAVTFAGDTTLGTAGVRKVTFSGNDPLPNSKTVAKSTETKREAKERPKHSSSATMADTAKLASLIQMNQQSGVGVGANAHLYLNANVTEIRAPSVPLGPVGNNIDSDVVMRPPKHRSMDRKHRDGEPLSKAFEESGDVALGGGNVPNPRAFLDRMKFAREQQTRKVISADSEPKYPIGHKRLVPKHLKSKSASQPSLVQSAVPTSAGTVSHGESQVKSLPKAEVEPMNSSNSSRSVGKSSMKQTMSSPLLGGETGVGMYTMHSIGDDEKQNGGVSAVPGAQTKHRLSAEDQKLWLEMFGKEYRDDSSDTDHVSDEEEDDDYSSEEGNEDEEDLEGPVSGLGIDRDLERVNISVLEPREQDRLPPHLRNKSASVSSPAVVVSTPVPVAPTARKRSAEKTPKKDHIENSLFKVMWCLLDDLFGHHNSVLQAVIDSDKHAAESAAQLRVVSDNVSHEIDSESVDLETIQRDEEALTMQRTALPHKDNSMVRNRVLNSMVERGISLAEQQLDIKGGFKVLSDSQGRAYHGKKSFLLGSLLAFNNERVGMDEVKVCALTSQISSIEWNMFGVLIVDVLLRSVGILGGISIDDGLNLSGIASTRSRPMRVSPAIEPVAPPPKVPEAAFDPVVATAANVDVLWLAKLEHALKTLIEKYNTANMSPNSGAVTGGVKNPAVIDVKPSMSYKALQDRELHHLRCYFNG